MGDKNIAGPSRADIPATGPDEEGGTRIPHGVSAFDMEFEPEIEAARQAHQRNLGATAARPIHVGGTSGTGKSAFAIYLLHTLLRKYPNNAFVYRHGFVNPGCFIYYQGKSHWHSSLIQVFSDSLLLKFLTSNYTRQIWTILDGEAALPTRTPESNMVVLSSPGQVQESTPLKILLKCATTIVNPPWTLQDIEIVREYSFPGLDKGVVRDLFMKWGGIPQSILDKAAEPEYFRDLYSEIQRTDPEILFRQAGLSRIDHANVSGTLFHLVPGESVPDDLPESCNHTTTFMYASYCWASTWLENRFWEEIKNRHGELNVMTFLTNRNNISASRAYAFEPHVFRTLENKGIKGRFKRLNETVHTDNIEYDHALPALIRTTFSNFADISNSNLSQDDRFYVPWSTNNASIDFYVPSKALLVQITIGQKRGVKRSGLDAALQSDIFNEFKNANPDAKLILVFLCDKFNYDGFTRQKYISSAGSVITQQSIIDALDEQVDQYAWELDVEKQKAEHLKGSKPTPATCKVRKSIVWRENPTVLQPKSESKRESGGEENTEKKRRTRDKGKRVDTPARTDPYPTRSSRTQAN
jgi:hypothetical protein